MNHYSFRMTLHKLPVGRYMFHYYIFVGKYILHKILHKHLWDKSRDHLHRIEVLNILHKHPHKHLMNMYMNR